MTDKISIAELERLENAATAGPWSRGNTTRDLNVDPTLGDWFLSNVHVGSDNNRGNCIAQIQLGGPGATSHSREDAEANAALIAASRNALAALLRLARADAEFEAAANDLSAGGAERRIAAQISRRAALSAFTFEEGG